VDAGHAGRLVDDARLLGEAGLAQRLGGRLGPLDPAGVGAELVEGARVGGLYDGDALVAVGGVLAGEDVAISGAGRGDGLIEVAADARHFAVVRLELAAHQCVVAAVGDVGQHDVMAAQPLDRVEARVQTLEGHVELLGLLGLRVGCFGGLYA
jgi:hypothetical protein